MGSFVESEKFSSNITTWIIFRDSTMTSTIKLWQFKLPPGIHLENTLLFLDPKKIQEISGQIEGKEAEMLSSGSQLVTGKKVNQEMESV